MYSFLLKIRYSSLIVTILIVAVFLIMGLLSILYSQYTVNESYKEQVTQESKKILSELDFAFDEATQIVERIINAPRENCKTEKYKLLKIIESTSWIRSVTITHQGIVTCSTFFDTSHKINLKDYTSNTFNLIFSKYLNPKRAIISYNLKKGDWDVFVNLPITRFFKEAPMEKFINETYIVVNNNWLNSKGEIFYNRKINLDQWMIFKSKNYPISVLVDYAAINKTNAIIWSSISMLSILFIMCLFAILYVAFTAPRRDLLRGLNNNEFIPYYQLIITADRKAWHGAEVLMRWQHPKRGLLAPVHFISLAERTKLIIPMTQKMMSRVASELIPYIDKIPSPFYVGFNISAVQIDDKALLANCKEFMANFAPNTIGLVLEITESQFLNSSNMVKLLQDFQNIGVRIAIDDFGTGYSNLAFLNQYKINHLKIDREFISKINKIKQNGCLVDTIINLAKSMNMHIVAEGVENKEQLLYLNRRGVEYIQGFLFNKPANINDMISALLKMA